MLNSHFNDIDSQAHGPQGDLIPITCDVLIVGSGLIGAIYAYQLQLLKPTLTIAIVDAGNTQVFHLSIVYQLLSNRSESDKPGAHKRNNYRFQNDPDSFAPIIQADLKSVSVPISTVPQPNQDPDTFVPWTRNDDKINKWFLPPWFNPAQDSAFNLSAEGRTLIVGGMSTHWTTVCPRFQPEERPKLDADTKKDNDEWEKLYHRAEVLIGVSSTEFDGSSRQKFGLEKLNAAYPGPDKRFEALPLACKRYPAHGRDLLTWHSAWTIFEKFSSPLQVDPTYGTPKSGNVTLYPGLIFEYCKFETDGTSYKVSTAHCRQTTSTACIDFNARAYIIAAGTIGTTQAIYKSISVAKKGNLPAPSLPALGHYITEHTMAFCQVALKNEFIDDLRKTPRSDIDKAYMAKCPQDPVPISPDSLEPQIISLFRPTRPWQGQVQRDPFYGIIGNRSDPRIVYDFRWYGRSEPVKENTLTFKDEYKDELYLPQPTFHFVQSKNSKDEAHRMMTDMAEVASALGGFLPGSNPQFMEPGSVPHLSGAYRAAQPGVPGEAGPETTVVDEYCQVHNVNNLFLGGNGVIPTQFAANPTLTSMCYAIRASSKVSKSFDP